MKGNIISNIKVSGASFLLLTIGFAVFRFVLLNMHGMKQFPMVLYVIGLIFILLGTKFHLYKMIVGVAIGYNFGYLIGALFNTTKIDIHGTAMNNWWILTTITMFSIISIALVWEIFSYYIKNTSTGTIRR